MFNLWTEAEHGMLSAFKIIESWHVAALSKLNETTEVCWKVGSIGIRKRFKRVLQLVCLFNPGRQLAVIDIDVFCPVDLCVSKNHTVPVDPILRHVDCSLWMDSVIKVSYNVTFEIFSRKK